MRTAPFIFIFMVFFACGGTLPPENEPVACEERQVVVAQKRPVLIKMFLDEKRMLSDEYILNSLNSIWNEAGVTVVRSRDMAESNAGLIYVQGGCEMPVEFGRMNVDGWRDLDSLIVDYACFGKPEYKEKFPAAASHALGLLMGVDTYAPFCSDGIMNERVARMDGIMPARLSAGDKESFLNRSRFSSGWEYKYVCTKKPVWEKGEYAPTDFRTVKFWADPEVPADAIAPHLNSYFSIFGRKFELSGREDSEFAINKWGKEYSNCSPAAIAYSSLREIKIKTELCMDFASDSERDATIVVHEVMHLFGVEHVPEWCGNAIMNPHVNPGPYFTPADIKAWKTKIVTEFVLK